MFVLTLQFYHSDPQRAFVTPRFVSSSRLDIICSRDQLRGQNKPRNIEKDVKVFPWRILESALKKIIGKYSVNPNDELARRRLGLYSTPPGQSMTPARPDSHTQYSLPHHH
ncbi:hypothetical protein FOMA001_g18843 [Fusarium oxysporum f. sp. matthiolae]|nr:hypothetical protein FOMA001_g18843 [Fusarium oxysporum f. sp. matthiolae]